MGVAERVSMSTPIKFSFSFSLCLTPKRCSSSMMTRPRSWNRTSLESRRWVPMTMSTLPACRPAGLFLLFGGAEAGEQPDFHRERSMREMMLL